MPKISKEEAARILDKTPRAVERYTAAGRLSVTYEKGKTRDVPVYERAEVERLAEESKQPTTPARGAIATHNDNADVGVSQAVAFRSQALERADEAERMTKFVAMLSDAIREAQAQGTGTESLADLSAKVLLTLKDAARLSSLSTAHLADALTTGKLKGKKIGRGWKIAPDELRAYVAKVLK